MSRNSSFSNFLQACKNLNYKKAETIFRNSKQADRIKIAHAIFDHENKRTTIHFFTRAGNVEAVRACLTLGVDKNVKDVNGWTPLLASIGLQKYDVAAELISSGADVNISEKHGLTPIAFASEYGHLPTLDLLLEAGADPNICGKEGSYPIVRATIENQYVVVEKLIASGANINVSDLDDGTALMTAINHGHNDIAELLIRSGADVNIKNSVGNTALISAVCAKNLSIVSSLVNAGAYVSVKNGDGLYPLTIAVMTDCQQIAIMLLKHGAKMARNPNGDHFPPAAIAAASGYNKMIDILLAFHVDFSCRSDVFDALTAASKAGNYEIVETLLAMRDVYPEKYPDSGNKTCFPALHSAAIPGHVEVLKLLLASGEDRNIQNLYDMTPFDCAEQNEQQEAMDLLMDDSYPSVKDKEKVQQRFLEIRNRIQQLRETIVIDAYQ